MAGVILVTGGSRGIGAATARLAAARGHDVCISYQSNRTAADDVVAAVESSGRRCIAFRADVARESDVGALFEACRVQLGTPVGLVNNAGMLALQARVEDMDAARLERVFAVNVTGSFLCAREAIKCMSTRHGGSGGAIVNLSSAAARLGSPNEFVDYAASKGAIDAFTLGLSKEVAAEGIRVNAVRPGLIDTEIHASSGEPGRVERLREMIPMQREGSAEEVARSILWLLSDDSSYVTGSLVDVAGGR